MIESNMLTISVLILLFLAGVQFYFFEIFFKKLTSFDENKKPINQPNESVSILVAARNELNNLQKLLPHLMAQQHPQFEVIVINDRSEDDSKAWLDNFSKKNAHVKIIHIVEKPTNANGKKYALLQGIKAAQYDILLLTDADCIPTSTEWIKLMQAPFSKKDTQIVLGYSPYESKKGFLNHFIQFETLYTAMQYLSFAAGGMPYMGVGRNLAYRKSFFEKVNGFEKILHITGGDDDLFVGQYATAQNTQVVLDVKSQIVSVPKIRWSDWFAQKKRHLSVGKYYPNKHKFWLATLHLSHLFFFVAALCLPFWLERPTLLLVSGMLWIVRVFWVCRRFREVSRKLQTPFPVQLVPLFDFLYLAYLTITGIGATSTTITWTKTKNDSSRKKHSKILNS